MTLIADARSYLTTGSRSRALNYLPAVAFALDTAIVLVSGALGAAGAPDNARLGIISDTFLPSPLILISWIATISLLGGYAATLFGAGTDEYKRVLNASAFVFAAVSVLCYLFDVPLSREFYLVTFTVGTPGLLANRFLLRRALYRAREHGNLLQRVVISGEPDRVDEVASALARDTWLGYHVVGAVVPSAPDLDRTLGGIPVIGGRDSLSTVVRTLEPDVLFFADDTYGDAQAMRRVVWDLESHDVQVVVAPRVADISGERVKVRPVGGLPLIHIEKPRAVDATRWAKRTFDIAGALGLIVLFAPVFALCALWIRLHDRGPVLFVQRRVGRDGHQFACLKFRSMVEDAEGMLAELHATYGFTEGLFKLPDDPRVTRPGAFMRRHSFDELPQLFNVLRGEMSLVGPRPALPSEAARYTEDTHRRLRVRPGMTGLWQVSGRADLSYDEAVRLDLYYVDNWSMVQDLAILMRTFNVVFGARGAY